MELIICGLVTGAAMTIPGVSGGSAAMILGIYDRLVASVSRVFSQPGKSLPMLAKFAAGGIAGFLLIARLISFLLTTRAELPLRFLFLGAVAGGIPMILRRADIKRLELRALLLVAAGAASVLLLSLLPEGLFAPGSSGFFGVILQIAGGILLAAALVLPGISASHFLYILGIYEPVMQAVSSFDILSLLPLGAGAAVGTFLTARVLEALIQRHQSGTFMVILGFMLGSLRDLIPTSASGLQVLTGIPVCAGGFLAVWLLQREHSPKKRVHRGE